MAARLGWGGAAERGDESALLTAVTIGPPHLQVREHGALINARMGLKRGIPR
jgi:hypothetical protein